LDLEKIVAELEQERDRLSQAIALLKERNFPAYARKSHCWEGPGLRSTTWPASYGGRQKAIVGNDEETLGREKT
jgi:hypothetical protein